MKLSIGSVAFAIVLAVGANGFAATPNQEKASVTIKQLTARTKALELVAERPEEHRRLATDYHQLAQLQRDEALKMDHRAAWYAQFPIYNTEKFKRPAIDSSVHFARKYRADAQKSEDLAVRHERLAS
jgi:hypothetical protein